MIPRIKGAALAFLLPSYPRNGVAGRGDAGWVPNEMNPPWIHQPVSAFLTAPGAQQSGAGSQHSTLDPSPWVPPIALQCEHQELPEDLPKRIGQP